MPTDTFSWNVRVNASEQLSVSTINAQFGDGYSQVASAGINAPVETWTLACNGRVSDMGPVREFLKSHVIHSFWWINPWGERKLYRVKKDSINPVFQNGDFVDVSFILIQAFAP